MNTPRETSPYNLLQEQLRDHPWRLLVACIMLNQTSAVQVKKIIWEFFKRWPEPDSINKTSAILLEDEMKSLLRHLGFQNRRFDRILGMTFDYEVLRPDLNLDRIEDVHGVGKYASDSFKIFIGGYLVEDVADKELKNYVRWAKERGSAPVDSGVCCGVQKDQRIAPGKS